MIRLCRDDVSFMYSIFVCNNLSITNIL